MEYTDPIEPTSSGAPVNVGSSTTNVEPIPPAAPIPPQVPVPPEQVPPKQSSTKNYYHILMALVAVIIFVAVLLFFVNGKINLPTHVETSSVSTTIPVQYNSSHHGFPATLVNFTNTTLPFNGIFSTGNLLYDVPERNSFIEYKPYRVINATYKNRSYEYYHVGYGINFTAPIFDSNNIDLNPTYNIAIPQQYLNYTAPVASRLDVLLFNNYSAMANTYATFYYPINGTVYYFYNKNGSLLGISSTNLTKAYLVSECIGRVINIDSKTSMENLTFTSVIDKTIYMNLSEYQITFPYGNSIIVFTNFGIKNIFNETYANNTALHIYDVLYK